MFFRLHEEVVRQRPWPRENDRLFRGIEVEIPISAAEPRGGHQNSRHNGASTNACAVGGSSIERFHEYPYRGHAARHTASGMGEKDDVATGNMQRSAP